MSFVVLNNILEATFRANPNYELLLFDRLPPEEQKVLQGLEQDPHFYGLLRGREPTALGVKSVDRDTALLYLTLIKPGMLPAYIRTILGDQCNQSIAELVLDGVLEIDLNGTFVSGAQAHGLIQGESLPAEARSTISRRSIEALKYAQALNISDSRKLSARLYAYGRQPVSPDWIRKFPGHDAIEEYLGIHARDETTSWLDQSWLSVPNAQPSDTWLKWNSRYPRQTQSKSGHTYKLYVSPAVDFVRDAFRVTVKVVSELRAPSFKVGGDVYGLLRPDKIIVYFWSFEELQEASNCLSDKLKGCPAHGVPFTAEIAGDGLLSWGIDPSRDGPKLQWQGPESWRFWVTNRLAVALLLAKSAPSDGVEPWQFALDRLRLEGVDTQTWTTKRAIWPEDLARKSART